MKNSIMTFDKREFNEEFINDYTSRNFRPIAQMPEVSDSAWIDYIVLDDDQKAEQISQVLYDSPDYWDILMLINNRDPLFDMVYRYDVLDLSASDVISKYATEYSGVYKQETFDDLAAQRLSQLQDEADTLRTFKIIRPEKISDFVKLLKNTNLNQ